MNTTNTTNTANTSAAASFVITKHYAKRDHEAQGDHYINHVSAMTGEGLHAKSDIAAELAHRDIEIERLQLRDAEQHGHYGAALLQIASLQARVQELGKAARDVNSRRVQELEAQLEAIGAGGVEPLRKRECLQKISEPAQPVAWAIFAENGNCCMWTQSRQNAEVTAKDIGLQVTPLYAAPQSVAQAQDAERYHWLRDNRSWQVLHRIRPGKSIEYRMRDDGDWWGSWWPTHEQAIDAARARLESKL